jgi:hypothetical protein
MEYPKSGDQATTIKVHSGYASVSTEPQIRLAQESGTTSRGITPRYRQTPTRRRAISPTAEAPRSVTDNTGEFESTMWAIVKESRDASDYDAYLEIFPQGRFAAKARAMLRKLRSAPDVKPTYSTKPNPEHAKQQIDPRTTEAALQLTRKERTLIQRALNDKNHQAGTSDGLFGQKTRGAIWRYQSAMGLRKTGFLTGVLAKELIEDGKRVEISLSPKRSLPKEQTVTARPAPSLKGNVRHDIGHPAKSKKFSLPTYVVGSTFIIKRRVLNKNNKIFELRYLGETESGYDFDEFSLSPTFQISRPGISREQNYPPVKFPFELGETWNYEADFESKSGRCMINSKMVATVSNELEKLTVSGQQVDVVRISHRGTQTLTCGGNPLPRKNNVSREFVYSPLIGMFVSDRLRVIRGGEPIVKKTRELISFQIPAKSPLTGK